MPHKKQSEWILVLIGFGKLLKSAMLLFIALKANQLLKGDAAKTVTHWIHILRIDPGNVHIHNLIHRVTGISPHQLKEIRLGSFVYAGLFGTEGLGLVLRRRWAEYLTVVTTSLLLPLEVYELFHGHHHAAKIVLFALNVVIVAYLIVRLRNEWKTA
ncbi:MAG TPA: DUF2127 domain-containing protein [Tepidisphaeraceae bacterium]|jgi:uncharacterized membrane protein (DUF2068 family)|nr:DUF2127 domain-containing protein [Tepidisphaeraceae bacterium]